MTVPADATPFTPSWMVANESQPKVVAGPAPSGSVPGVTPTQLASTYTVEGGTHGGAQIAAAVRKGVKSTAPSPNFVAITPESVVPHQFDSASAVPVPFCLM